MFSLSLYQFALAGAAAIVAMSVIYISRIIGFIGNDSIGVIEKLWSLKGSLKSGFIALDGSAGFQPEVLRGGVHFFPPFQYRIHVRPLPSVPQGTIGYVFARSGANLAPGQTLGVTVPAPVRHYPEPENIPLSVVFEDNEMLVVNKQAGRVVHPGAGNHTGTLVNALL